MRRRQIWASNGNHSQSSEPELTLEEQYKAKFGTKPHHRMKRETIIRKLRDDDTG